MPVNISFEVATSASPPRPGRNVCLRFLSPILTDFWPHFLSGRPFAFHLTTLWALPSHRPPLTFYSLFLEIPPRTLTCVDLRRTKIPRYVFPDVLPQRVLPQHFCFAYLSTFLHFFSPHRSLLRLWDLYDHPPCNPSELSFFFLANSCYGVIAPEH